MCLSVPSAYFENKRMSIMQRQIEVFIPSEKDDETIAK